MEMKKKTVHSLEVMSLKILVCFVESCLLCDVFNKLPTVLQSEF